MPRTPLPIPTFMRFGLLLPIVLPLVMAGLAWLFTGTPLPDTNLGGLAVFSAVFYLVPYTIIVAWHWKSAGDCSAADVRRALVRLPALTVAVWVLCLAAADVIGWAFHAPTTLAPWALFAPVGLAIGYAYSLLLALLLAAGLRAGLLHDQLSTAPAQL